MNRRYLTSLLGGGAVALVLSAGHGFAQDGSYPNAPFREHPAELARAAALERVEVTARAFLDPAPKEAEDQPEAADDDDDGDEAAAVTSDDDAGGATEDAAGGEEGEEDEGLLAAALPLFEASLAAKDAGLATDLRAAVTEMLEAREAGEDSAPAARETLSLAERARAVLIPADLAASAPFEAAVMASLLLDEGGVSESYEEASEGEGDGYLVGAAALARVKELWAGLGVAGAAAEDGAQALASLDALFPSAEVPDHLSPDPEEAEAPSHALVAVAEGAVQADLYPGRDLGAAAGVVHDLAAKGCGLLGSDAAEGRELLAIAGAYGGALLADPLSVMDPEAGTAIGAGFDALGDGGNPDCDALLKALGDAQAALAS